MFNNRCIKYNSSCNATPPRPLRFRALCWRSSTPSCCRCWGCNTWAPVPCSLAAPVWEGNQWSPRRYQVGHQFVGLENTRFFGCFLVVSIYLAIKRSHNSGVPPVIWFDLEVANFRKPWKHRLHLHLHTFCFTVPKNGPLVETSCLKQNPLDDPGWLVVCFSMINKG